MNLYYAEGDQQVGPIGKVELQSLIKSKKVNNKTLVWQPGMESWQELGLFVRDQKGQDHQKKSVTNALPKGVSFVCMPAPTK